MSIAAQLSAILAGLDLPPDSRAILVERFAGSIELIEAGEEGVALENLCDNLFEFDVRLAEPVRDRLVGLCQSFGVAPKRMALLDVLASRSRSAQDG